MPCSLFAPLPRRMALGLAISLVAWATTGAQNDADAAYDALLNRYVKASPDGVNRVDYAGWRAAAADRAALDGYIAELSARRPSAMTRAEAFAFWGNL